MCSHHLLVKLRYERRGSECVCEHYASHFSGNPQWLSALEEGLPQTTGSKPRPPGTPLTVRWPWACFCTTADVTTVGISRTMLCHFSFLHSMGWLYVCVFRYTNRMWWWAVWGFHRRERNQTKPQVLQKWWGKFYKNLRSTGSICPSFSHKLLILFLMYQRK